MEKEKSFEEALEELEKIVKELEMGNAPLDEAIKKYTAAMNLAKICNDRLDNATKSVNKILEENGKLEDFSIEE